MFCSQCGTTMDGSAKFCQSCGSAASDDGQDLGVTNAPPTVDSQMATEMEKTEEVLHTRSNVTSDINEAMNLLLKLYPNKTADVQGPNTVFIDSNIFSRAEIQYIFEENKTSFNVKSNYLSLRGTRWFPFIIWLMFIWVWPISIPLYIYDFILDQRFNKKIVEDLSAAGYLPLG